MISFDDTDVYSVPPATITSTTNLTDALGYLQANITGGNIVAFVSKGNTYMFQDGDVNPDTLVELVGVAASINNTGLVAGLLWLV
jgi:hypothetical protein